MVENWTHFAPLYFAHEFLGRLLMPLPQVFVGRSLSMNHTEGLMMISVQSWRRSPVVSGLKELVPRIRCV